MCASAAKVAYFAVPWLVTLCSQGVAINAVIDIWDVLLNVGFTPTGSKQVSRSPSPLREARSSSADVVDSNSPDPRRLSRDAPPAHLNIDFLLCFCVAMLRSIRSLLMMGTFAADMVSYFHPVEPAQLVVVCGAPRSSLYAMLLCWIGNGARSVTRPGFSSQRHAR